MHMLLFTARVEYVNVEGANAAKEKKKEKVEMVRVNVSALAQGFVTERRWYRNERSAHLHRLTILFVFLFF